MKHVFTILATLLLAPLAVLRAADKQPTTPRSAPQASMESQTPGVDEHTIALWLFDDALYNNVILSDAGPHQLDLRLNTGRARPLPASVREGRRGLLPGRFGGALHLPMGDGAKVAWAEGTWKRSFTARMFSSRFDEVPELCNLGYLDYTIEFWLKTDGKQSAPGVIWEVRNEERTEEKRWGNPGFNALMLDENGSRFFLRGLMVFEPNPSKREVRWDQKLEIPTDAARLGDGQWHHVAFTYSAREHQMRHYLDGRLQPLPKLGGFLPLTGLLTSMTLGNDAEGKQELHGALDEFRISSTIRYTGDFAPPGSFSRNFGAKAPASARADGPPLLFASNAPAGPVALGTRKHVFIDDALLERMDKVTLTCHRLVPRRQAMST